FSPEQVQEFNIQWHKPEIATKVDREQKQVHLESGQILPYDKLLIATGSRARVPVNTWQFIPNVVTLRNVRDCERLAEILKNAKNVAVIGGGWIGLEIAATARKQGKDVHIFEYGDRLCARSVSPEVSAFLKNMHEAQGTKIHLDSK
ncbi:FAD-dependent oxidoreductase, partial [Acinetobacter pittii]